MTLNNSRCMERWGLLTLLVAGVVALLPGIWEMPLLDRDEPRFSQATVEMMERQEWVVPYFNGQYRFDKPPLTYWWMRLHYHLFSVSEFAARLHSVVASLLVAIGIYLMGRRHFNARVGWFAGFAWLTCFQVLQHGRLALADMPMIAAVFYACWALYELVRERGNGRAHRGWFWLLYLSLGIGFLAKGPIAIAIPLVTLLLYRWVWWRHPLNWKELRPVSGLLVSLMLIAAWGIPALLATDGLFWKVGVGKHVVDRGLEAFNERWVIPGYYLLTTFISLFPWMALLGKRLKHLRSDWNPLSAFLVSWLLSPYLVFLFYSTQLPHYVLPAFPALLIWIMASFDREDLEWGNLGNRWFWGYVLFFECLLTAGLIWVLGSHLQLDGVKAALGAMLFLLLLLNALVVAVRFRVVWATISLMVLVSLTHLLLATAMRSLSPVIPVASMLEELPETSRTVGIGFEEPSLVFYTGRTWDFDVEPAELEAEFQSEQARKTCYVILEREYTIEGLIQEGWNGKAPEAHREIGIDLRSLAQGTHVVLPVEGINFARMRWSKILVLFPMDPLPSS